MQSSPSHSQKDARAWPERLHCPQHFQDRINHVGGFNRYGEPNFKLSWAQTETTHQGGEWEAEGETYVGYREILLGDGLPHWMLLQWVDAGKCIEMPHMRPQSDVAYYHENRCPKTGLQLLGEYPYRGSYKIALSLCAKFFEAGQMRIRGFPLSSEIVNMMIPIIKASMLLSVEAKMRWLKEQEEQEEKYRAVAFDDAWKSVKLPEHCKTSGWIEDKVRSLEKAFNAALITRMHRDRVFQSQNRV